MTLRHITHLSALYAHSRLQNDIRRHNDAGYQERIVVIMVCSQCKVHRYDDTLSRTSYITEYSRLKNDIRRNNDKRYQKRIVAQDI